MRNLRLSQYTKNIIEVTENIAKNSLTELYLIPKKSEEIDISRYTTGTGIKNLAAVELKPIPNQYPPVVGDKHNKITGLPLLMVTNHVTLFWHQLFAITGL